MAAEYRPNYLSLYESGGLEERVRALEKMLLSCNVCPLDCGNNRMEGELARCFSGRLPVVSSHTSVSFDSVHAAAHVPARPTEIRRTGASTPCRKRWRAGWR